MKDSELTRLATDFRVFAEVRAGSAEVALRAAEAAIMGGIKLLHVGLTTPGCFRVISDLRRQYGDRATIGVSSVMSYDHIDRATKSGAQFIVMPHTSPPLIEACRRSRVTPVAGALTPTEIAAAWSMSVPIVMVFPAALFGGPEYFQSLTRRMSDVRLVPSGGVGSENIVDYFSAGAFAINVSSRLFTRGDLQNENYAAVAERARGIIRLAGIA